MRILVVDDEPIVTEVVERYLRLNGHDVRVAEDGESALEIAGEWDPKLVILDLMLPGMDGMAVCRQLRTGSSVPIIMLTAKASEDDRIAGLELGADDYVAKPFSPRELMARVKSVLRRTSGVDGQYSDGLLRFGQLVVDPVAREVTLRGQPVALTAKEFDLLTHFASHPGQVFTHDQIMNHVWTSAYNAEYGTITVHISRLRSKIEEDPMRPLYVKTVWGVGYKFDGEEHGP